MGAPELREAAAGQMPLDVDAVTPGGRVDPAHDDAGDVAPHAEHGLAVDERGGGDDTRDAPRLLDLPLPPVEWPPVVHDDDVGVEPEDLVPQLLFEPRH